MSEKYAALAELEALAPGPLQQAKLREAAARWPGCLRESQLAGPEHCGERRRWAEAACDQPLRSRGEWLATPAAAVPLWADLHELLADQVRWRTRGDRGDVEAFLNSLPDAARIRWPSATVLKSLAGAQVRSRQAYLWLAMQVGWSLPQLNFALFARCGPWDQRPGDKSGE